MRLAVRFHGKGDARLDCLPARERPRPTEVICDVEAVSLCYSDVKLSHQFEDHPRKAHVVGGLPAHVLARLAGYAPGALPTVPGHEFVVRVRDRGEAVRTVEPGMRAVICPDLRWLPTPGSSAAYGYNFEGGLQQDLCLDERVFMGPEGSALLPIDPGLPSAWAALAEPWSCIEHSYSLVERNSLLPGGRRLVVGRAPLLPAVAAELAAQPPGEARYAGNDAEFGGPYDDVIVVGADPDVIERALGCLAHGGHLWLLTAGARVPRSVRLRPAAFHYEGHRLIGTTGTSLRQAAAAVSRPYPTGRINLVGATGAMGQLHLAHLLSLGAVRSVHVGGRSPERLALLQSRLGLGTFPVHTYLVGDGIGSGFDGIVLLAPDTSLVQRALHAVVDHGWVDLFAGCARDDTIEIDLEDYVARGLYLRGTSGSTTRDIAAVLHRLATGSLDPGPVLSAESGMAGALEALLGVGRHHMLGKTVVYPGCSDLGLRPLPFGVQTRASVLEHERALGLPHRGPQ